jgi:hypothetical protein
MRVSRRLVLSAFYGATQRAGHDGVLDMPPCAEAADRHPLRLCNTITPGLASAPYGMEPRCTSSAPGY